jgi:formylglycine-generating enzyme required for sulfatase activity
MKLHGVASILNLLVAMMLVSCAASETVVPTRPPSVRVESTVTVLPPKTTESPAVIAATASEMEVGSTYYYVDGTTLVAVPAGEFLMGADGKDNSEHVVILNDYWIYSTKVTNQQYALCEAMGKCTSPNLEDNPNYKDNTRANDPVVGVTYDQAATYCSFVHGRLPTEAEWEKSARNPDGSLYPWGDTAPSCDLLNFNNCVDGTTNVINYPKGASYYGGLDLVGNAFEWVADWYSADYYAIAPKENPEGPSNGTLRSVRASSYTSDASQIFVTNRAKEDPQQHRADLGFRCVVEDPTYFASACASPLVYGSDASGTPQPAESCPVLDIKQGQFCSGETPMTNVRFSGPPDAKIDPSNCTPSGDPNLFTCQSPDTIVTITAICQLSLAGNTLCPGGFSPQDQQCVANGSAGQCLTGDYDSAQQCCTTQNSTDSTLISSVCPVGTFYSQSKGACLAYTVKEIVSVSVNVGLLPVASCATVSGSGGNGGGGNDGGGSSTPTTCAPLDCGINTWSPTLCCCTVYFDPNTCQ